MRRCSGRVPGDWLDKLNGSTLAAYTSCLPREHQENLHAKSIIQSVTQAMCADDWAGS